MSTSPPLSPPLSPPIPPKRHPHWLTRELDTFLHWSQTQPFVWSAMDCCLFAANAVLHMTGADVASDFRGKYSDEASAFALIKSVTGGTTVADAAAYCATKYGLPEWVDSTGKPLPLRAMRGDLVVVNNAGTLIAGIVDLSGKYVAAMSDTGIVRLSIRSIVRAWHVPF